MLLAVLDIEGCYKLSIESVWTGDGVDKLIEVLDILFEVFDFRFEKGDLIIDGSDL